MNQKILKIIIVLMLVVTLTMANFVLLCANICSRRNNCGQKHKQQKC